MNSKRNLLAISLLALLASGLSHRAAIAQSASIPLSGNYVGTTSGACSPGYPVNQGDVIKWMTSNNTVSQVTFFPEPAQSFTSWLSSITLNPVQPFTAVVVPGGQETVVQYGILKRSVGYGSNSAVGEFNDAVPPAVQGVVYNQNQQFIVASYPFPDGTGAGYYLYLYVPFFTNFFKYGAVFNQTSSQATSVSAVFQGNLLGCSFSISYVQ